MTVPIVPWQDPGQSLIHLPRVENPYLSVWWTAQTVTGVPEQVMGWLVSQGWEITNVASDYGTTPPTYTYTLGKQGMQPWQVLLSLCNSYTTAANEARDANEFRYNQIVRSWSEMAASTQTQFAQQVAQQDAWLGVYLSDLRIHLNEVDGLNDAIADRLPLEYDTHKDAATGYLDGLGQSELARINELFDATLSTQLQDLMEKGLYSSAVAVDIKARNARDRNEEIVALNDRLNREKLENAHRLYGERASLSEFQHKMVQAKMNSRLTRLEGWKTVHEDNMKLMAYQLDTRNNLIIGLYSFVERRDDIGPQWKDMAQMIAGLGDAAGGWITP